MTQVSGKAKNLSNVKGETKIQTKDRAITTLCDIVKNSHKNVIGISTHEAFISCLFYAFGLEVDYNRPKGVPFHLIFENNQLKLADDFKI